jgi:DNA-binding beta-propeller fold protein YncE
MCQLFYLLSLFTSLSPNRVVAEPYAVTGSIDVSAIMGHGPEGIAFDPASGHLFVVQSNGPDGYSTVFELTTGGALVNRFTVPVDEVEGVTMLPNGNLLFTNSMFGGAVAEYTTRGHPVADGLNFTIGPPSNAGDGIVYHVSTGTIFIADNEDRMVYRFSSAGELVDSFVTNEDPFPPDFTEPAGLAFDTLTGQLLLIDSSPGTASLYAVRPDGRLKGSVFLGGNPEGVTIDPATRAIYIADDDGRKILVGSPVPEPATYAMMGLGLAGLFLMHRRRQRQRNRPSGSR